MGMVDVSAVAPFTPYGTRGGLKGGIWGTRSQLVHKQGHLAIGIAQKTAWW